MISSSRPDVPVTLHILSASPLDSALLEQCCETLQDGDALLLIGEGVRAAWPDSTFALRLAGLSPRIAIHVLTDDASARGLEDSALRCVATDYPGFVALACAHARSVSWY